MKDIEFDSITIKDYGAIKDLQFSFADLGMGVHFVRGNNKRKPRLGSNGAGKSSIFNAWSWCLWGKTIQGLRGPDVIPWGTKLKPDVTTKVWVGDGDTMRAKKIRRSTVSNGLWINGKVVNQEAIDRLLGITYETFLHTIILGQGKDLFFDLGSTAKMALLSETLDLDRWEVLSKRAKDKVKDLDVALGRVVIEIANANKLRADHLASIADLKQRMGDWERERANKTDDIERKVKAKTSALEIAEKNWGTHDLEYDGAETELRAAQKAIDAVRESVGKTDKPMVNALAAYRTGKIKQQELREELANLKEGGECPTCGQALNKAHVKKHRRELEQQLEDADAVLESLSKETKRLEKIRETARLDEQRYSADVRKFRDASNAAIDARGRAETVVERLKAEIAALKSQVKPDDEVNPYSELLAKARSQLKTIKEAIAEFETVLAATERKKTHTKYWVDGFKNVRLYLLQEVLDELQAVTQTLLPSVGLDGWEVLYSMERETKAGNVSTGLTVAIKADGEQAVKWESWSGGEGQRLRLIGAVALSEVILRRAGVRCDMMVFDEPTKHLSPEGVTETIDFLIERGREQQIWYIDHTAVESTRFASVVSVIKDETGVHVETKI